jgi:hypothetical protein
MNFATFKKFKSFPSTGSGPEFIEGKSFKSMAGLFDDLNLLSGLNDLN